MVELSPAGAPREREVPCVLCHRGTWNFTAKCSLCMEREEMVHGWDHADDERYTG